MSVTILCCLSQTFGCLGNNSYFCSVKMTGHPKNMNKMIVRADSEDNDGGAVVISI